MLPSKLGGMLASGKPIVAQAAPASELYTFLTGAAALTPPGDAAGLVEGISFALEQAAATADSRAALARQLSATEVLARFFELLVDPGGA